MAHYSRYVRTELLRHKCFSLGEPNCDTTVQESGPSSREIAANDNKGASVMIISRRSILGTAAAGVVTAATANAQTSDIPQPERPGKGGTDISPRDVIRDRENPDVLVPNSPLRMLSKYSL
jgi:hypothetical protein